jgi:UPF0716 protein FxsA
VPLFIFLVVIVVFAAELWVLVQVGEQIGTLSAVLATLLTAAIGIALVKRQGLQTLARAQEKMAAGESPAKEVFEGISLFFAGIFLLLPGFVSDSLGVLLLIPGIRGAIAGVILRKLRLFSAGRFSVYNKNHSGHTYEGQFTNHSSDNSDKDEKNQNFLP